ncbi:MAG TPA: hypothetical protein VN688_20875 [Gemmataceae bacterium]|nr:hypothetical protein [Gemmataceae bacterium]
MLRQPIRPFRWFFSVPVLLALMLLPLAGCAKSNKAVIVSGKITHKGKPLGGGTIQFHPTAGGGPIPGGIKPDGTFSFGGVPPGESRITIETESIRSTVQHGGDYMRMPGAKIPEGMKVSSAPQPTYVPIPKKYADLNTSGLTWDVNSGNATKNFDLTD